MYYVFRCVAKDHTITRKNVATFASRALAEDVCDYYTRKETRPSTFYTIRTQLTAY